MSLDIIGKIFFPEDSSEVLYEWNKDTLYTINKEDGTPTALYKYDPSTKMMMGNNPLSEPFCWNGDFLPKVNQPGVQSIVYQGQEYWVDSDKIYRDKEGKKAICRFIGTLPTYIFGLLL